MIKHRAGIRSIILQAGFTLIITSLILAVSAAGWFVRQAESREVGMGGKNPIIARVGKTPITIQDIEDKQINELRVELHKRLQGRLQILALKQLSKTNPEYGLEFHPDISEKDISDFYRENDLKNRAPLAELRPRIRMLLHVQAISEHYESLYNKAVKKGLIVPYLTEPNEFLIRVPTGTAFIWGGKQEKVMVLEFSDYQCPFCSRIQSTMTELRNRYNGKVAFGYRHSPLEFHQMADEAAIAAECARDQGKFQAFHKILFKNHRNIAPELFDKFAREAGVANIKQFDSCVSSERYRSRVQADQKVAREAGINGTPGFVIGRYNRQAGTVTGEILSGAQPISAFTKLIDKYLNKN